MDGTRLGTQLGIVVSLVLFFLFIVFFVLNFIPYIVDFPHWSFFFFFLSQLVLRAGVGAWVLFFSFGFFFFFLDLLSVASYSWYTLYIGLMVIFYCRYSIFFSFYYYYFYTSSFWGPGDGGRGEGYDRYLVDNVIGGPGGGLLGFFFFFVASV